MKRKKISNILIALISVVLLVMSVTGCAKKDEEASEPEVNKVGIFNEVKTYEDNQTYESGVISTDGVVLKNAKITNDLTISDEVGNGTIYLDNIEVKGILIIEGGGENSIHISNSKINKIVSNRKDGRVRINVSENTTVSDTEILQDTKLEVNGSIDSIKVGETAKGSEVLVHTTATVSTVETKGEISLTINAEIDKLSLQAPSNVVLNASVEKVAITKEAENTAITVTEDVVITSLATEGKVDVQGEGKITNAITTDKNNITGNVKPDSIVISETPISDQENQVIVVPTATPVTTPKPTVLPTATPWPIVEPTSDPAPQPTPAPKPVTTVTISGNAIVGETLTAVSDGDVAKTTTWYANDVEVGTNSSTYVVDAQDYGKVIKVKVNTIISAETSAVVLLNNMVIVDGAIDATEAPKYKTINEAINASTSSGSVYILKGEYAEQVDINKAITLKGTDGVKVTGTIQITASDNAIVNIDGFNVQMSDAATTSSNNGIIGITSNATVNINNMNIKSENNKGSKLAVGIRMTGMNAKVNVTNSNIDAYYYGISLRNSNQTVNIDNSTIKGWGAVMTSKGDVGVIESNSSITIKNSTLESVTISQGESNAYGVIVLQEGYNKVNLSVNDSILETGKVSGNVTNANQTAVFDIRSFGNTVNFTNCTMNAETALNSSDAGVIRIGTDNETTDKKVNVVNLNNNTFKQGVDQKLIYTTRPIIFGEIDKIYVNGTLTGSDDIYRNQVTITDASIAYQEVDQVIVDFTTDKDIVLNSYTKTYTEAELIGMYNKLFLGTNLEKQEAANKIGNDVLLTYYYFNEAGDKIPLKTITNTELVKFKVWSGYLYQKIDDGYKELPAGSDGNTYFGQTVPAATWRTSTSPATGTVSNEWLNEAKGHVVGVDIVIVYQGNISCEQLKVGIPLKNSDLSLNAKEYAMPINDTFQLNLKKPENIVGNITWTSSNTTIATVNSSGLVTAKNAGTTIITAELLGAKATMKVEVVSNDKVVVTMYTDSSLTALYPTDIIGWEKGYQIISKGGSFSPAMYPVLTNSAWTVVQGESSLLDQEIDNNTKFNESAKIAPVSRKITDIVYNNSSNTPDGSLENPIVSEKGGTITLSMNVKPESNIENERPKSLQIDILDMDNKIISENGGSFVSQDSQYPSKVKYSVEMPSANGTFIIRVTVPERTNSKKLITLDLYVKVAAKTETPSISLIDVNKVKLTFKTEIAENTVVKMKFTDSGNTEQIIDLVRETGTVYNAVLEDNVIIKDNSFVYVKNGDYEWSSSTQFSDYKKPILFLKNGENIEIIGSDNVANIATIYASFANNNDEVTLVLLKSGAGTISDLTITKPTVIRKYDQKQSAKNMSFNNLTINSSLIIDDTSFSISHTGDFLLGANGVLDVEKTLGQFSWKDGTITLNEGAKIKLLASNQLDFWETVTSITNVANSGVSKITITDGHGVITNNYLLKTGDILDWHLPEGNWIDNKGNKVTKDTIVLFDMDIFYETIQKLSVKDELIDEEKMLSKEHVHEYVTTLENKLCCVEHPEECILNDSSIVDESAIDDLAKKEINIIE